MKRRPCESSPTPMSFICLLFYLFWIFYYYYFVCGSIDLVRRPDIQFQSRGTSLFYLEIRPANERMLHCTIIERRLFSCPGGSPGAARASESLPPRSTHTSASARASCPPRNVILFHGLFKHCREHLNTTRRSEVPQQIRERMNSARVGPWEQRMHSGTRYISNDI